MAFFSALILDGAAASSAQVVPVPNASDKSIAATTDDFISMFVSHFVLPNGASKPIIGSEIKKSNGFRFTQPILRATLARLEIYRLQAANRLIIPPWARKSPTSSVGHLFAAPRSLRPELLSPQRWDTLRAIGRWRRPSEAFLGCRRWADASHERRLNRSMAAKTATSQGSAAGRDSEGKPMRSNLRIVVIRINVAACLFALAAILKVLL